MKKILKYKKFWLYVGIGVAAVALITLIIVLATRQRGGVEFEKKVEEIKETTNFEFTEYEDGYSVKKVF